MGTGRDPVDALDVVEFQDDVIEKLTLKWREAERRLVENGGVNPRWDRGSAIKMFLMHMAVREAARTAVAARLAEVGETQLADLFEDNGLARRLAISRLEEELRGLWAIDVASRELIDAAEHLDELWRSEVGRERNRLLPTAAEALGPPGQRGLPSARAIRAESTIHPRPSPRWYDRFGPAKAVRACFQYWRNTMGDTLSPAVEGLDDHTPGPR